jgi:RHS repeat-associated protein
MAATELAWAPEIAAPAWDLAETSIARAISGPVRHRLFMGTPKNFSSNQRKQLHFSCLRKTGPLSLGLHVLLNKKVYTWNAVLNTYQLSTERRYVYDGWNLVAELNGVNAPQRTYLWGLDLSGTLQAAGGVGGLLAVNSRVTPTGTFFVSHDGRGNVTQLTSGTDGTTVAQYAYGPFGELIRKPHPGSTYASVNPFLFSTKFWDAETDLLYYGDRYYNPTTGRWLNRDPIGELGGLNLYAFSINDCINYIDPYGNFSLIGGLGSVAFGYTYAKLSGNPYGPSDFFIDLALGSAGVGLVNHAKRLASLRRCIKVDASLKLGQSWELQKLDYAESIEGISRIAVQVKRIRRANAAVRVAIDNKTYQFSIGVVQEATITAVKAGLKEVNEMLQPAEAQATLYYETKGDGNYKLITSESNFITDSDDEITIINPIQVRQKNSWVNLGSGNFPRLW